MTRCRLRPRGDLRRAPPPMRTCATCAGCPASTSRPSVRPCTPGRRDPYPTRSTVPGDRVSKWRPSGATPRRAARRDHSPDHGSESFSLPVRLRQRLVPECCSQRHPFPLQVRAMTGHGVLAPETESPLPAQTSPFGGVSRAGTGAALELAPVAAVAFSARRIVLHRSRQGKRAEVAQIRVARVGFRCGT